MIRVRRRDTQPAATGYVRRTAAFEGPVPIDDIWFTTPEDARPLSDDWLLLVGTLVGMVMGEETHIVGRVSERLFGAMDELQWISCGRRDVCSRVHVTADEVAPDPPAEVPRTVSCFSAGVDAFFSALHAEEPIDELLYVHGLETRVQDQRQLALVLPHVKAAAAGLGKPLRLAESNWRSVIEPLAGHDYFTSAPLLPTIAYLMGSHVSRLVLPATHDPHFRPEERPSVTSLVSLWSTESLEIVEHGLVPRIEKVRRLVESDVAMRHLRICWARDGWTYNCGRCGKCLRTRVHLKLLGSEGRCATLPPTLALPEIMQARPERAVNLSYLDDNIAEAEARNMTELAAALRVQRRQDTKPPTWRGAPRSKLARFLRKLRREHRKWRTDRSIARLRRRHGDEHLFNCVERMP